MLNDNVRIGNIQASFMIATAALLDLIQVVTKFLHFVPVIGNMLALMSGWFISICAAIIFPLWFRLNKVKMMSRSKGTRVLSGNFSGLFTYLVGLLIESTPIINALPGWSVYVCLNFLRSRVEDKAKKSATIPSLKIKSSMATKTA